MCIAASKGIKGGGEIFAPDPFGRQAPGLFKLEIPGQDLGLLRKRYGLLAEGMAQKGQADYAGVRRLPNGVLRLSGKIDKKTPLQLSVLLDRQDGLMEVNSGGGDAVAAMEIAEMLHERRIEIRLDGLCMSACANYLLPAARKLSGSGLVGFHGDPNALLEQEGFEIFNKLGLKAYLSVQHAAWRHRKFFEKLGKKDCLSRVTQAAHRGAGSGVWSFYVPNAEDSRVIGIDVMALFDFELFMAFMLNTVEKNTGMAPLFYSRHGSSICD